MKADEATVQTISNSGNGITAMYYFAGYNPQQKPIWANVSTDAAAEAHAAPLLSSFNHPPPPGTSSAVPADKPCIGEQSVRWIAPLNRFLLTYGSYECNGLQYRTATTPWGPWSAEAPLFPNRPNRGWASRIIDQPGSATTNFNTEAAVALYDGPGNRVINTVAGSIPYSKPGNPYGPYQYPASTAYDHGDGTVSVLMNLSGFNPYVTWQMAARFYKPGGSRVSGRVMISGKARVSP